MQRSRSFMTLAGAASALAAMAACSPDAPNPVAPAPSAAKAPPINPSSGRYILSTNGTFGADLAAKVAALGGKLERVHTGAGLAVVSGVSDAAAGQLAAIPGVNEVEPDATISLAFPVSQTRASVATIQDAVTSQANPTTASRYAWQWNMRLIDADKAWANGKLGSPGVTVAILDTGIDYDAPDLLGLVDLSRSTSFIPSDDSITAAFFPSRSVISDYNGHGTNVATQVSSKARALAGVTSKSTLIGVKVLSAAGSGAFSSVLNGVLWAADHDADVANMSLGGGFAKAGNGRYIGLINKVFNYAKKQGMVVVVAAGNDGSDLDRNGNFFASYCDATHVICVSSVGPATAADFATNAANTPAYYTNYGRKSVDVAGPGGNADAADGYPPSAWPWGSDIASWVWSYCSKTMLVLDANGKPLGFAGCQGGNLLTGYIGTSQATPHVAGLAALLVAEDGRKNPDRIKKEIEKSAYMPSKGMATYLGSGRIDVAAALRLQ